MQSEKQKMVVLEKAFACSIGKDITGYDCDISDTFYGETPAQARFAAYREWDFENIKCLMHIKVRRNKWSDRVEPIQHELAASLSKEQKDKMMHTIFGSSNSKKPYRNHYQCGHDADYEALILLGLADKTVACGDMPYYYLTGLGKKVILSTLPVTREWFVETKLKEYEII